MKIVVKLIIITGISIAAGIWISKNLQSHYIIEEYYSVQNLDPKNEKDAESLRERINQLIQKNVPARYWPNPDKFQCFKIISESVFFCSADTARLHVAEYIQKLLTETIPQEIGWINLEDAIKKTDMTKDEINGNKRLIAEQSKLLEKLKKQNTKNQTQERKIAKTNDLYKKNLDLIQKKMDVLHSLLELPIRPDLKDRYNIQMQEAQQNFQTLQDQYSAFFEKNKKFTEGVEQRETLRLEIAQMKEKTGKMEKALLSLQERLANPNAIGKIADADDLQLIPDTTKSKSEFQRNDANAIWFSLVIFFLLSNVLFRFKPTSLVPYLDDLTITEGMLK